MSNYIPNIIFFLILISSMYFFISNLIKLYRNINLGISVDLETNDNKSIRIKNMLKIAFGQSKLISRPISGILHAVVYVGFIIINIELIEIIIDGLFGTHRIFSSYLGSFYGFLIATFEILAISVIVSVLIFWIRRNILKISRFFGDNMSGWPKNDANYILYFEVILMTLFLVMNATDVYFQKTNNGNIISGYIFNYEFKMDIKQDITITSF